MGDAINLFDQLDNLIGWVILGLGTMALIAIWLGPPNRKGKR